MKSCAHPLCDNTFTPKPKGQHQRWCSHKCKSHFRNNQHWLGEGLSTRVFFRPCKTCGALVTMRAKAHDKALCADCRKAWYRAHNARKNHARRAAGSFVMTVFQIAERDGCSCYVCGRRIDMSLSGRAKWGPTIEHLIPVSKGGTNAPDNLTLSHRHCNTARGNRGHAQLLLIA